MKKIKGLLLFGILSLLGIGSSFGIFFDLKDNTGSQILIPSYSIKYQNSKRYPTYNYILGTSSYLSGELSRNTFDNHGVIDLYVCRDSNLNIKGFSTYGHYGSSTEFYTIPFGDISNCFTFSKLTNFDYLYIRNDVSISPYSLRKDGPITRYLYFDDNNFYTYTGITNDIPSGYTRQKLFLSVAGNYGSVSSDSSGNYLLTSLFDDSFFISNSTIYSGYILLHFGGYDTEYYNGAGTLLLSLGDNVVYFNYYTGFYLKYSDISLNTPSLKGVLADGNSSSDGYTKFINLLNNGHKIVLTYGSINNGLSFYSYGYVLDSSSGLGGGYFTTTSNYFFNFQSDNSVPTFITPSGNGNQSTGSIAINTGLLNSCLNDLTFGELNSYLCNQLLSNLGYPVQIPGTSGQYISVSIDENGNLRYWITTQEDLEEQMSGFVWVENEDGTRSTVCPSGDCLGTVLAQPILHGNTGFEFTTGTILDMITNLTGWVGRCPFPYTDFRLGQNTKLLQILQNYGLKYDPFIFINCAVAGFHYGRHSIDRQIFDDTFEHPLLYGDTQKHRSLFVFLDFIVILGLLGLSAFLKKIF